MASVTRLETFLDQKLLSSIFKTERFFSYIIIMVGPGFVVLKICKILDILFKSKNANLQT